MGATKTILSIEVTSKEYSIKYSGGFRPDFRNLTGAERKAVLRHDGHIINALMSCPDAVERIAGFVHCIESFKRREARKAKSAQHKTSIKPLRNPDQPL